MYHQHINLPKDLQEDLNVHVAVMPYLWTIVIDLAIIMAKYKYTKYAIIVHAILCAVVSLATMSTALPILFEEGIYSHQTERNDRRHYIIGLIIIFMLCAQILIGFLSKLSQMVLWINSYSICLLNKLHKYLGYSVLLLVKIQVFLELGFDLDNVHQFWALLVVQGAMLALLLSRTIFFPKLQEKILPDYSSLQFELKRINHLGQLGVKSKRVLGVFANYVYDISPLKTFHPAGFHVIKSVADRGFDRYLYGMYRSQKQSKIPVSSHSYKALKLLGNPLAKLSIPILYSGFETDIVDVYLSKMITVSQRGNIYQVYFKADDLNDFEYHGYSCLQQLGRCYSLTINQKVTRLYTCLGFLAESNLSFFERKVFANRGISIRSLQLKNHRTDLQSTQRVLQSSGQICILMRKYQCGKLTPQLFDQIPKSIKLSCPRGQGLKMMQIKPGHIILVAGGTGIYPFSDLIDLLYKSYLLSTHPKLKKHILNADPLLGTNPFAEFKFTLYLSVNYIQDLHPLTFAQLEELSKNCQSFKLYLRVSKAIDQQKMNQNIQIVTNKFSKLLIDEVAKQNFQKMLICGPPAMNEELLSDLGRMGVSQDKYLMI